MTPPLDDGLDFSGYPQPPDVPPDPSGNDWQGPPGEQGIPGPPGPMPPGGPFLPLTGGTVTSPSGAPALTVNTTHTQPVADYIHNSFISKVTYTANDTGGDSLGLVSYIEVDAGGHTVAGPQHIAALTGDGYATGAGTITWINAGMFTSGNGGSGTVTNTVDIRGHPNFNLGGGALTNHWFLYQEPSTSATNEYGAYFSAPVGIGTYLPQANLDIYCGAGQNISPFYGLSVRFPGDGSLFVNSGGTTLYPGFTTGAGCFGAVDVVVGYNGLPNAPNASRAFLYISSCLGTPIGVPSGAAAGRVPLMADTGANKLWMYINGNWDAIGGGLHSNGGTLAGNLTINTPGEQWSTANVGKQLLLKTQTLADHPGIGIADVYGTAFMGIYHNTGNLIFASMPDYANTTTPPVVMLTLTPTGMGFNGTAPVAKRTGWGAPTGTATRTTFVTGSVTLPALAEHVKALIDDLTAYGLIGA